MTYRLLGLAAAVSLSAGAGLAGDMNEPETTPAPAQPAPAPAPVSMGGDWTGFYAGGSLGYGDVSGDITIGDDVDGLTYGAHAGYDYDLGNFVVGGEFEISGADISDESLTTALDVDSVTRLKVRAGYDAGAFLPYATAGYAMLSTSGFIDDSDDGYFYGVGMDYKLRDNIRIGGELLQHEFDDYAGNGIDVEATTVSARMAFEF